MTLPIASENHDNGRTRSRWPPSRFWRDLSTWLLLAGAYAAAGKIGLALAFVNASATAVWPPTGIALAAILLLGPRAWPGIFLGAFLVNETTTGSLATSFAIAIGNTLEALIGAYLVMRFAGGRSALQCGKGIALFAVLAGLVSTTVSATVGVTSLLLGGFARSSEYGSIWVTWWLGDAMGAIVVTPVILLWAADRKIDWSRTRMLELALALVSLVAVGWAVFVASAYPVGFLALPVCIWVAFRFGQREAATATCVLSVLATWATVHGHGSFAAIQSPNAALLVLHLFMGVTTLMGLTIGAATAERTRVEDHVRRLNIDLEQRVRARTAELQAAHDQLLTSEGRLKDAQRVAHIGSWEWTVADNSEWWSEELYRICGFEPDSFRPSYYTFVELLHADDRDMVTSVVRRAMEDHRPFAFEHRIVRPDGEVRILHSQGQVVVDQAGYVVRMLGTSQDTTARRAAEEIVSRSERRLKTIIDTEPACVKLVSPEGILLDMNRAGLEMVEAEEIAQLIGRRVVDLVHPDDRIRYLEMHRAAMSGSPGRLEFRVTGLHGGQRWVDSRAVPFDGSVEGSRKHREVLSVTTDITERKRLEDQLRQAQKLDALGRLVGSVSHDFNNFLTALIGYTELALKQIGDDETVYPDLKNDLLEVLKIGRRASALTRQLLMFSRLPTLDPPVVSVDAILAPFAAMLVPLLGEGIRVHMALGSGETGVRIDPSHLEQIVVNLAVNARDAMPRGGVVSIETSVVTPDETAGADKPASPSPGSYVLLAVSDTGSGMDEHVKAHLFEPFFTTKAPGKGTGLGLATVYGITKQSGGCIGVDSDLGRGTAFKLYFPLVPELPPLEAEPRVAVPNIYEYQTVLIVDDDEHVRAVAGDVLRESGYHVLTARTGEEATQLAAACDQSIHVLITDVVLPGMSGRDLVDRLRHSRPALRTLFISGYGRRAIAHHGLLDANEVLLEKPFTSAQLLTRVRAALDAAESTTRGSYER